LRAWSLELTLQAARVGTVRGVVCASPAYLAERGTPLTPADLAENPHRSAGRVAEVRVAVHAGPRAAKPMLRCAEAQAPSRLAQSPSDLSGTSAVFLTQAMPIRCR